MVGVVVILGVRVVVAVKVGVEVSVGVLVEEGVIVSVGVSVGVRVCVGVGNKSSPQTIPVPRPIPNNKIPIGGRMYQRFIDKIFIGD